MKITIKKILPSTYFLGLIGLSCPVLAMENESNFDQTEFAMSVDSFARSIKERETTLLKENKDLRSEVDQLKENVERLTRDFNEKSSCLAETEKNLESTRTENNEVKQAVTTICKQITGYENEKDHAVSELEKIKQSNEELNRKLRECEGFRGKNEEMAGELERIHSRVRELENELSDLRPARDQLNEARNRIEQLGVEKNQISVKLEKITNAFYSSELYFRDGTYDSESNSHVNVPHVFEKINAAIKYQGESHSGENERHGENQ